MIALTVLQPWAWAITIGKPLENRGWPPPPRIVGQRIAIHAGKLPGPRKDGKCSGPAWEEVSEALEWMAERGIALPFISPRLLLAASSAVVATAKIGKPVTESDSPWFVGKYGWPLEEKFVLPTPVLCRGQQGLWTLPPEVDAAVEAQAAERKP